MKLRARSAMTGEVVEVSEAEFIATWVTDVEFLAYLLEPSTFALFQMTVCVSAAKRFRQQIAEQEIADGSGPVDLSEILGRRKK